MSSEEPAQDQKPLITMITIQAAAVVDCSVSLLESFYYCMCKSVPIRLLGILCEDIFQCDTVCNP